MAGRVLHAFRPVGGNLGSVLLQNDMLTEQVGLVRWRLRRLHSVQVLCLRRCGPLALRCPMYMGLLILDHHLFLLLSLQKERIL